MRFAIVALLFPFLSGCGVIFQTIAGWHSTETVVKPEQHVVRVTSAPVGAEIIRRSPDGAEVSLGVAPLSDSVEYSVEQTIERPKSLGVWIGAALEIAGTAGLVAASDGEEDVGKVLMLTGAVLLGYLGIQDLVVGAVHTAQGANVVQRKTVGGSKSLLYAGKKAGLPDALALIRIPDQGRAELVLDPEAAKTAEAAKPGAPSSPGSARAQTTSASTTPGGARAGAAWVLAVMDVEDTSSTQDRGGLDVSLTRNLGDQLRVLAAARGVRTIDRGQQERALREQLQTIKQESYKECYDDNCQVELGKALAASHILRSRIARFGKRCVLNAELIDLRAEVSIAAASAQGDCQDEGFLEMSETIAKSLFAAP